ncbi:unnamed protein product, partial [Adineta steineri]
MLKAVELEGISVEALADPSLYQQPVEFDEDEQISQFDTQQSRTSIKTKAKLNIGPSFAERKRWRDTL